MKILFQINITMESLKVLYQKAKKSLVYINKHQSQQAISIINAVLKEIQTLRILNPELKADLDKVHMIALNNLACALKKYIFIKHRKGKYRQSLEHLKAVNSMEIVAFQEMANESEQKVELIHQMATTHSNICAVYSQIGDHNKALKEINLSISKLQSSEQTKTSDALVVCYYNCAIQLQYLNSLNEAHRKALRGYELSQEKEENEMKKMFVDCLKRLEEKMKKREHKIGQFLLKKYKQSTGFRKSDLKPGLSLHYLSASKTLQQRKRESSNKPNTGSGRVSEMSKMNYVMGEKDQKSFSMMSIDSTKKMVAVGSQNQMRPKSNLTISLKKKGIKKLLSEQF